MKLGTVSTSHLKQSGNSGNVEHLLDHVPEGGQFIASPEILPRMDSGGILDVATAAGLYLTSSSEVLPPDQYPPEEILSAQDLTEEDRKLAAALVAVQLVQQQKQQQLLLNEATVNTAANTTQNIISKFLNQFKGLKGQFGAGLDWTLGAPGDFPVGWLQNAPVWPNTNEPF